MFFVADGNSFEGMSPRARAEYLQDTFESHIKTKAGIEATGVDILWAMISLEFPLLNDGLLDREALLLNVMRELGSPEPDERKMPDQIEAVINVLLAVDMLNLRKDENPGYVPATDISMFRAVLYELGKIVDDKSQEDTQQNLW